MKQRKKKYNNYKKIVLSMDLALDDDYDGIHVVSIVDWLLS